MAFRRTPNLGLLGVGISRKHAAQALYGLLALGAVAAIIAALFLDLKLLDGLNKADRCGDASDNLVLDNGIVLTQTMGTCLPRADGLTGRLERLSYVRTPTTTIHPRHTHKHTQARPAASPQGALACSTRHPSRAAR